MWLRWRVRKLGSGQKKAIKPEVGCPEQQDMAGQVNRVLSEARAIVEGTVVNRWVCGCPQPPDGWLNKLAHADWAEICALSKKRYRPIRVWEGATSFLAAEMRAFADTPEALLGLQRGALIPLELEVLAGRAEKPESPLDLIEMVTTETDKFRSRIRRKGPN